MGFRKTLILFTFAFSLFPAFTAAIAPKQEFAIFAGGCFWCMEPPFEKLKGVQDVISGYSGGKKKKPSYKEVSSGKTGHIETVKIVYDPTQITYRRLLKVFWKQIDPTDSGGQFVDRGLQYTSGIFYANELQRKLAEESKSNLEKSKKFNQPIATFIRPFSEFYPAEDYHQDYYKKNPIRYRFYRYRSGRDGFLKRTWGKEN